MTTSNHTLCVSPLNWLAIGPIIKSSIVAGCLLLSQLVYSATLKVAVAANFAATMKILAEQYERQTPHKIVLSIGSSGKHFAQISHGAPFDVFFSADIDRAKRLEQEGLAVAASRFTYALGRIVLWSPRKDFVDPEGKILFVANNQFRIAIANPRLAPYGRAAKEILQYLEIWKSVQNRIVRGENIGQAYQFVVSGNAQLGFIAYAQIKSPKNNIRGSYWEVPKTHYQPIEQQAVLLRDSEAARDFIQYIKSDEARRIVLNQGYLLP